MLSKETERVCVNDDEEVEEYLVQGIIRTEENVRNE